MRSETKPVERKSALLKIITPWLGIMLVALGVGAAVGPPHAAADTATPPGEAAAGAHAGDRPAARGPDGDGDRLQRAYGRAARYVDGATSTRASGIAG